MTTKAEQKLKAVDFMKELAFEIPITWRDASGTHRMDDDRHVNLSIITRGHTSHYTGVNVRVMHKKSGEIDRKFFLFDNFLDRHARSDNRELQDNGRPDYPLNNTCCCFQVISTCGWFWYIAVPKTTRPFCEAVEGWIEEWR